MATTLSESARALLDGKNFATVATVQDDGRPQQSVVWVMRDGDEVIFSVLAVRQKYHNLARDPRLSVLVTQVDNPYAYAEIRGTATLVPAENTETVDALSVKYTGKPYTFDEPGARRVTVRVTPEHVVEHA